MTLKLWISIVTLISNKLSNKNKYLLKLFPVIELYTLQVTIYLLNSLRKTNAFRFIFGIFCRALTYFLFFLF